MSSEIVPANSMRGKRAARRVIKKEVSEQKAKVGFKDALVTIGTPIASVGALAATAIIEPWLFFATAPVLAAPLAIVFGARGSKLSDEVNEERDKTYTEYKESIQGETTVEPVSTLVNNLKTRFNIGTFLGDEVGEAVDRRLDSVNKSAVNLKRNMSNKQFKKKVPIKGLDFASIMASAFGTRKAYLDASEIGLGEGFTIEYTYRFMKLVSVEKVYLVNEEKAWEDAFNLAILP